MTRRAHIDERRNRHAQTRPRRAALPKARRTSSPATRSRRRPGRRPRSYQYLGSEDISKDRYIDPSSPRREFERLWTRTWQMACREEHIPEAGDYYVYDIGPYSFVVTRAPKTTRSGPTSTPACIAAPSCKPSGTRRLRQRPQVPVPRLDLEPRRHASRQFRRNGTSPTSSARQDLPARGARRAARRLRVDQHGPRRAQPGGISRRRGAGASQGVEARGPLHLPARRRRAIRPTGS